MKVIQQPHSNRPPRVPSSFYIRRSHGSRKWIIFLEGKPGPHLLLLQCTALPGGPANPVAVFQGAGTATTPGAATTAG